MDSISGKVALVTGSSRGIGRAIAIALARAGADVALNYRTRKAEAEAVENEIRGMGTRCEVVQADVGLVSDLEKLVRTTERELGHIHILVNNAGIAVSKPLDQLTVADFDHAITTNLRSCFVLIQAVLPGMRDRRWGRIINVSSVAAQLGGVVGPHYAASKAGQIGLTHGYASLVMKDGVTVNAIAPALIETEMVTSNPNASPSRIPVGRYGHSDEVAEVAVMLARNGYITGQTINVNGGWYMA